MIGTLVNAGLVIVGGMLGTLVGSRLSERLRNSVMTVLGLFTIGYGLYSFLKTNNVLIPLGGMIVGTLLGEWWRIEELLSGFGEKIKNRVIHWFPKTSHAYFVEGFVTTSLLFCVGPMAILGSIQDGVAGDPSMLIIKAVMDGFAAVAFASTLGIGVVFSAFMILIYQGGITLLASFASQVFSANMIAEMTAVGGLILVGLALSSLLGIKKIRIGSFLPALIITPLVVWLLDLLAIAY